MSSLKCSTDCALATKCSGNLFHMTHSKNCGVHSTPNSCHTIGCESHQPKFGVLCTPSHGVIVSWRAQHTNLGVLCTPI